MRDIDPKEVDSIKEVGTLFGDKVKMILLKGGFHLFVGKKKKTTKKAEVLAGSSHAAIGVHQLTKDFGSDFQPALAKSESERIPDVENKTEYLPSEAIANGIELYTINKNHSLEFILYKRGLTLGRYQAEVIGDSLVIKKHEFKNDMFKANKDVANAMSRAMKDEMHKFNLSKIEKGWL